MFELPEGTPIFAGCPPYVPAFSGEPVHFSGMLQGSGPELLEDGQVFATQWQRERRSTFYLFM